ncbi:CoA-transferase subunit beta [Cohnella abietis]|uniref:3-oxoadipate--succinyl-CoA transferase subunit B n=1 Tax=Cohnella abietis TaxID=2507935 RepID=A0A3T1CZ50_9BACL|nr:CoA-transferase [Cohnella abietis]BBI31133.1 3-oxoadipate--succinyl-CoA transferase subunit B [Cohnella abietis]
MSYNHNELMICALARELKDGEVIGVGNNSPIPAAASLLAKELHAPNAEVYVMGQADWPFEGTKEFFDLMQRGGVDVFFLSGAQIDAYGNINLHVIGDYDSPKVRLPGGAGASVVYFLSKRTFLFKTDHTPQGFPEQLDFKTSVSSSAADVDRPGRLEGVFTPLGILRPSSYGGRLQLSALAPGIEADYIQQNTGFELALNPEPPFTLEEPTVEELSILRNQVREQLKELYPEFASTGLLHTQDQQ